MSGLVRCEGCARHIYAREPSCPFCGEARTRERTATPRLPAGLSRAQRIALALALTTPTALGCTDSRQPKPPVGGRSAAGSGGVGGEAGNGLFAGQGATGGAGQQGLAGNTAVPVYGAPAPVDAGPDSGPTSSGGAGGAMSFAMYGASPSR